MKFRSILLFVFILLALSACSLADDITPPPGYQSPVPQPTLGPSFPAAAPDLTAGAVIFAQECAPCHGAQGLGNGPQAAQLPKPPTALGQPEIALAAVPSDWYKIVTQGEMDAYMPPFTSLDDQQRWDVVAYSLSLGTTPAELAQGKAIYEANCVKCHGADGKQSVKSDFSNQARMAALSQTDLFNAITKGVDPMPAFAGQLSEAERYAAAAYLRTFSQANAPINGTQPPASTTSAAETEPPASTATAAEAGTAVPTTSGTPESAASAVTGTPDVMISAITGKITNKSGGAVPAGLKVTLHVFEHDAANSQFSEISTEETTIHADGTYSFAKRQMPASQGFYVSVVYANTTYQSDPVVPTAGQTAYNLPVDIYETTTDASGLFADQLHIILDYSQPDTIQVVEFYIISNPGTKTIIPAQKGAAIVTASLPKGYTNLQFQDGQLGDRYIQTADGFGDTLPVPPGSQKYQLVFAFKLPYNANFDFVEPFSINVSSITFLVSEGVKADAPGIIDGGLKDMGNGGSKYQLYTLDGRKVGESIKVSVSGSPSQASSTPPASETDSHNNIIIGVGALGLALILTGGWLFWRDRKRAPVERVLPAKENEINSDEIIDAIIALDDQYKAGNIVADAYQQRRAELKEQLKGKI